MEYAANTLTEKLSEPRTLDALTSVVDGLTRLHDAGALDSLMQAAQAVSGQKAEAAGVSEVITFMTNSVTDKMVEHNAEMMGELLNIAHESADPSVAEALRELKMLQKSGNLRTLAEASDMIAFMSNAVTDTMVQRLTSLIAAFVEEVSTPNVQDSLRSMTRCMSMTVQEFAMNPPKPGIKNLLSAMRDPEVQQGMMFMTTLAKNMHKCMIDTYSGELGN